MRVPFQVRDFVRDMRAYFTCWHDTIKADDIDPTLLVAMGRPTDTDALFTYALDNLIESVLTRSRTR